ncbi:site-specific DNA-methyltransferase [Mesorhizobium sp. ASY16-5R]|uniref:site-specific DNA-methyltransferase n=1 Tax=Mesorhizobium sp. ASY16-5R TaxID=3445772 RepID=UPI003F9FA664
MQPESAYDDQYGQRPRRLELVWVGKEDRRRPEPRILIENTALSVGVSDRPENRLVHGDNLLALKALESEFTGKVKCCFIDPPYNTGSAFAHYDDGLEHSIWLGLMRDRLEIIRRLLADDGSLWISIDDNEAHYLKVLCDEIFGRRNFVANVVWQKRTSPDARLRLGGAHDHILVFAKDMARLQLRSVQLSRKQLKGYRNVDGDPRGDWASSDYSAQGYRPNQMYEIRTPGGAVHRPAPGTCWKNTEAVFQQLVADNRIYFGKDGRGVPRRKTFLAEREGVSAWSWWDNGEAGHNQEAKKESIALFGADKAFATPKPERLIKRVLDIATGAGDLVLDSFAGSGTTGAVAHKMGRRWIMVEIGDHAHTHIIPRLAQVIDGTDGGGITDAVGWHGGGGYRYYELAPSLIETDAHGRGVVSRTYGRDSLIEAVCKLEGFAYAPSDTVYWQHGRSTERDFVYVVPRFMVAEELALLSEDVGTGRSLLVMCRAFRGNPASFPNLTVRKIPNHFIEQFDWGQRDYRLNVGEAPAGGTRLPPRGGQT